MHYLTLLSSCYDQCIYYLEIAERNINGDKK